MNAIHLQAIVAIVVSVAGGLILANDPFKDSGPLNIYVFIGTMLGLLFAGIYIAVNLAVIGFYLRERRDEFNFIKHLIVPILGVVAMIPAIYSVIGGVTIPLLNVSIPAFSGALSYIAPIVGVWMVIGIVIFVWLWTSNRDALTRMGDVYGGDGSADR